MKSIINQYKSNIKKIISSITGSDNEDIEQEVYIRTWKNINKYKEKGKFKSWISVITANLCRDYLKSSYFRHNINIVSDDDEIIQIKDNKENIENRFIQKERQQKIINAIDGLKPKLKEVIIMYEMYDMNYDEISKKLKVPTGTIKSRLFTARKELSELLKDLI